MRIGLLAALVLLTGCSSLSEGKRNYFARAWIGLHNCQAKGLMDAQTAGMGRAWINSQLSKSDAVQLNASVKELAPQAPQFVQGDCDRLAGDLQGLREVERSQPSEDTQVVYTPVVPRQTYCNRFGTQTFCSSY
jgi:hypothetical protein